MCLVTLCGSNFPSKEYKYHPSGRGLATQSHEITVGGEKEGLPQNTPSCPVLALPLPLTLNLIFFLNWNRLSEPGGNNAVLGRMKNH